MSDSEFEDDEENQVVLPQDLKRKGNLQNNKSAVRLYEVGPRMTFELIKIEEGLLTGEVLYHETIVKSPEEIEELRKLREKKKKLKEQRKKIQAENKLKKEERNKAKIGKKELKEEIPEDDVEPDNDAEYYKQEVGEEPDDELFKQSEDSSRKRIRISKHKFSKKKKLNSKNDSADGKFKEDSKELSKRKTGMKGKNNKQFLASKRPNFKKKHGFKSKFNKQ